jgi:hypothetical protein
MSISKDESAVSALQEEPKSDLYNGDEKDIDDEPGALPSKYRGTAADKKDMSMLGKTQVLRVCGYPFASVDSQIL